MGNYRGNPNNFPTSVAEYDDSIPPDASQFNPATEGAQDQIAHLYARAGSSICSNWGLPANPGTGTVDAMYCWDPFAQRWLAAVNESGTELIVSTHDSGKTWVSFSPIGGQASAISSTGQFGETVVAWLAGTVLHFDFITPGGVKTTGSQPNATTHLGLGYFSCNPSGAGVFQRHAFCFDQVGANFTGTWLGNTDGGVPGTWTTFGGLLPASWQGPTALHIGEVLVADTTRGLRAAVAGDVMIVILAGATIGTDAPMALKITSNGAAAAVTVAEVTANLPVPGTTFTIGGIDYDEVNKLWGLFLNTTGAGGPILYTSPDFATWTKVHQFLAYNNAQGGCAVAAGTWAVWVGTPGIIGADSIGRVLFSWDVAKNGAGSTWISGQGISLAPAANLPLGPCHLRSNGAQLLAGQGHDGGGNVRAAVSHWNGFQPQSIVF